MVLPALEAQPWRFQAHVEVWMVVAGVVALGVYVAAVIAPKVPPSVRGDGPAVTAAHKAWFALGVAVLWISADWPLHDLAEQYLYGLHMVQHLLLTLVVPPLFWLATPRWLARLVVPPGSSAAAGLRWLARPVPAAVIFNALVIASHWTGVVNTSVASAPVHYLVHLVLVAGAFLMWVPVCGPWPELRLGPAGTCVYLFTQSIVPTVPGAWLTMAESPVYAAYDHLPRLWGISAVTDQQYAGLFMKLGGGAYLWGLIIVIFFRWALAQERDQRRFTLVRLEDGIDRSDGVDGVDRPAAGDDAPVAAR
jgi:putative membrane protein